MKTDLHILLINMLVTTVFGVVLVNYQVTVKNLANLVPGAFRLHGLPREQGWKILQIVNCINEIEKRAYLWWIKLRVDWESK